MARGETRTQRRVRLESEGRWKAYVAERAILVKDGASSKDAAIALEAKYGPGTIDSVPANGGLPPAVVDQEKILLPMFPDPSRIVVLKPLPAATTLAMFEGRECDERTCVKWVFEMLYVDDVKPEAAPSSGAWGLLQECKRSVSMREDFITSIWPKLLPTKNQMELKDSFSDDGRDVTELIQKLQAAAPQEK